MAASSRLPLSLISFSLGSERSPIGSGRYQVKVTLREGTDDFPHVPPPVLFATIIDIEVVAHLAWFKTSVLIVDGSVVFHHLAVEGGAPMQCTVCRQQLNPEVLYCPRCHSATPALGIPFADVERRLAQILARQKSGSRNDAAYQAEIQDLIVRDQTGNTWWLGGQHGAWHWFNGRSWERRDPARHQAVAPQMQPAPSPTYRQPAAPNVVESKPPQSQDRRSWFPYVLIGCIGIFILSLIIGGVVGLFILQGDEDTTSEESDGYLAEMAAAIGAEDVEQLSAALTEEVEDHRPQTLEMLGRPDTFSISEMDVDGHKLVQEAWLYYGLGTQVDFINGEAAYTSSLDPVPEETIFPAWYDPLAFSSDMMKAEIIEAASGASPAGTIPVAISSESLSDEFPGGEILIGDQILIGVYEGRVVYIETVALFPEEITQ